MRSLHQLRVSGVRRLRMACVGYAGERAYATLVIVRICGIVHACGRNSGEGRSKFTLNAINKGSVQPSKGANKMGIDPRETIKDVVVEMPASVGVFECLGINH